MKPAVPIEAAIAQQRQAIQQHQARLAELLVLKLRDAAQVDGADAGFSPEEHWRALFCRDLVSADPLRSVGVVIYVRVQGDGSAQLTCFVDGKPDCSCVPAPPISSRSADGTSGTLTEAIERAYASFGSSVTEFDLISQGRRSL